MKRLALTLALLCLSLPALAQGSPTFGSPQFVVQAFNYKNITTDATFAAIKSGPGVLGRICINNPAATETITIFDSLTGTGTKLATITLASTTLGCFQYDANFHTGLSIITATAAGDITVLWQ